jgi:hypothetical protein
MHLVKQNSQSPPINGLTMTLVQNNLRGNVLRSTANSESSSLIENLGKSEIGKLQITVVSDQEILGFEISIDDILGVKVFKTASNSGSVESGLLSRERFDRSEVSEELSSVDQLKNQIEILGILSESLKVDDERMRDLGVNEILIVDVIDLLGLDDLSLVEKLQGNILSGLFVFGDLNLAETTYFKLQKYPCRGFSRPRSPPA